MLPKVNLANLSRRSKLAMGLALAMIVGLVILTILSRSSSPSLTSPKNTYEGDGFSIYQPEDAVTIQTEDKVRIVPKGGAPSISVSQTQFNEADPQAQESYLSALLNLKQKSFDNQNKSYTQTIALSRVLSNPALDLKISPKNTEDNSATYTHEITTINKDKLWVVRVESNKAVGKNPEDYNQSIINSLKIK